MTRESRYVRLKLWSAAGTSSKLFGIWLLCASIVQSGCAPVDDQPATDAPSSDADLDEDAELKAIPFLPWMNDVVTIEQGGPNGQLFRDTDPDLEQVWTALARVTRAQLSMILEHGSRRFIRNGSPYLPYSRFAFHWGAGRTGAFGESGLIPDSVSMEFFNARFPDDQTGLRRFAIDGRKFLQALRALSSVEYNRNFAVDAVGAVLEIVEDEPGSLSDRDYIAMAKLFYASVMPAFSHEVRADVQRNFRRNGGLIGTAAYALANGYAELRRWAERRGLVRPGATLIMTASVVAGILSQSVDLMPDLWLKVAELLCS